MKSSNHRLCPFLAEPPPPPPLTLSFFFIRLFAFFFRPDFFLFLFPLPFLALSLLFFFVPSFAARGHRAATLVLKVIACPAGEHKPGVALAARINAIRSADFNIDADSGSGSGSDWALHTISECQPLSPPGKDFYAATFFVDFMAFLLAIMAYEVTLLCFLFCLRLGWLHSTGHARD